MIWETRSKVKEGSIFLPNHSKTMYGYVRSSFLRIDFDEAALAVYLPVQQFKKASESQVWKESRGMI